MKKALHWSAFCFGGWLGLCELSEMTKALRLYVSYAVWIAVHRLCNMNDSALPSSSLSVKVVKQL